MKAREERELARAAAKADGQDVGDNLGGWLEMDGEESQSLEQSSSLTQQGGGTDGRERSGSLDGTDEDDLEDEASRVAAALMKERKRAQEKEEKERRIRLFATVGGALPSSGSDSGLSEDGAIDELQREVRRRKRKEAKEKREKERLEWEREKAMLGSDVDETEDIGRKKKKKVAGWKKGKNFPSALGTTQRPDEVRLFEGEEKISSLPNSALKSSSLWYCSCHPTILTAQQRQASLRPRSL